MGDVNEEEREAESGGDVDVDVREEMDDISDGGASGECGMPSMEFGSEASVDTSDDVPGSDDLGCECE